MNYDLIQWFIILIFAMYISYLNSEMNILKKEMKDLKRTNYLIKWARSGRL